MTIQVTNTDNVDQNSNADLATAQSVATYTIGGTTYLYVGNENTGNISVYSVAANGTLTYQSTLDTGSISLFFEAVDMKIAEVGGHTYLIALSDFGSTIGVFSVDTTVGGNGALSIASNINDDLTTNFLSPTAIEVATVGGTTYVFVVADSENSLTVFSIAADGTLTEVDSVIDDETLLLRGATSVALAEVGGTTYAFVGSLFDDGVSVFSVANDGSLTHVQNVPDGGTNSLLQTVAMTTAEVDGTTYLVVSARFDDTLTVFSVGDDGTLTKAFEVSNTISNRLNSPIELISATFGGATYIFSGSNIENGFSVFLLGADGSLSDVANLADDATVHLDNPTQSTTVVIGGTPYLISVGNDDHGVSVFQISDLPTPGAPSTPDLAVASDTGQSDSDNLTADDTPTFTGTAQVGSTVRIFVDGVEIAQGVAVDGTYSLTPADRLADGTYAITATATNAEGEASAASAALNVTIDATAPGGFSTVGNNSRVNDLQSEHQAEQVATSLADGSYVVVWTSYDSSDDGSGFALKAKIFNSNGFQAGPEFQVTTQTIESQQSPTVTTLSNGNFVVVWRTEDPTQDGSLSALKMQIFLPDGTKSGAETLVNTQFTDFQVAPSVSALGNGGIVVTWQTHDTTQDGSGQAIKAAVFDSNGTQVGTEFLVNTETDSNQIEPEVTALPDGGFVVAWQSTDSTQDGSDSAIKAQRFDDAGTKLGAEFLVNSEFDGSQVMRSITALANGGFVVAWDTNDTTQDGSGQAVKARVFASDGTPAGNEFLLNTNATGDQAFVTLTALSTGGFVAAWRSIESTTFTIPVQVFDDTGKRVGPETTINGITNSYNGLPDLVDLGNGRFVALWDVLTGSDTEVYAQILELNAPKLSLTSDLDQDGRTENLSPSITFTAEAGATLEIDWDDGNGFVSAGTGAGAEQTKTIPSAYSAFGAKALKLRITDAAGNSATQPLNFTVEDGTPPTAPNTPDLVFSSDSGALSDDNITNDTTPAFEGVGAEAGATLRLYANGTLVGSTTVAANGTWSLTSSVLVDGVYDFTATATDAAGNTSPASTALSVTIDTAPPGGSEKDGTEFQVTTEKVSNQDFPVGTLLSDGSHILVWQTQDPAQDGTFHAIKAQRFAADGSPLGTEFLVNTNTAGAETLPAVTALQNGNYVVTWNTSDTTLDTDGASVRGQIFAPDGTKVGSEFQVNQQFALEQNYSSITTLEGGAFVVLWNSSDATQDGSGSAIKGRIFQEDGTGGAEFLVNTNSAEGQLYPKVSDLPGGGFVATWITMDTTADGSDWAIKAQRFDAAGAKVGAEFLVNTDATDRQNAPSVATLENGSFVITWHTQDSTQDGSSYAIKARIYDSNGVAAQGEFLVNSETDNQQDLAHVAALSGGGFVIAWRTLDTTQDGSLSAIKAQQFDANGSKIGSESLVNTIPDLLQTNPHIVGLADDRFVITWSSTHDASVSNFQNIQAQVFKPAVPSLTLAADPDADGQTTDTTPTIAFFAEPGTLVEVNWGDGNGYVVSGNGTGAVQEATIPTAYTTFGAKFVQVRITDLAGNSTIKSLDFTLLPPQPDAPTAPVLDASSDTGASNSDLLTNDTTPTFTGSGVTPGDTVTLLADGTAIGTALADAGGTWQITATPLVAGALDITATVTNGTNQTSDPSPALSITIDTTAPNAPAAVDLVAASDSGASDTDNVTVDDTPTFEGSGVEPGARVTIFADGTPVGTGTADASGNWSVTSAALSGGQHAITATQTDAAGNSSVASLALQVTVDTTAPTITAQDITIQIGSGGVTLITAQDIDSGSADNIALSSLTLDQSSFDTSDIGSAITVTLTGTDVAGNQASDTALVTVEPRATFAFDATALTQTEGDSGSQPVQFSITRTGDTSDLASVTISRSGTADNSDVTSGGAATFTVDFQPGEATVTLDPAILGDTNFEPDETLVYTITNVPLGSQIGGANAATLTIQNDDQPAANLFVSANTGSEAGATLITVTVTSNAPVAGDQTVDLAVTGVQAGDFILSDTTITILDGQTTGTATFTVVDDSVFDGPETAVLTLSNPSAGLSLGTTTSQSITITDNDETASTIVTTAADVVDSTDGVTSLREAVAHANAGDTITFDSSLSTITLDEDIVINKQITIDGDHTGSDGKADITLTTDGDNRHFNVQSGGTLNLHSLTLTDGVVTAGGGSVLVNTGGILSIEQSTFSGNSGVSGGAILSLGSVTVSDSTFSMNSAISPSGGSGGAINIGDGSLNATNSSFVGNTASGGLGGSGGAIFRGLSAGTVSLTQVTLTGNSADAGGAIEGAGAVQLTNTIVSGNTAGTGANIRSVTVNDLGGNILNGDVATIFAGSTPALADNGGPVQTVALLAIASNPALDVASTGPGTDARGQARSDIPGIANGGGAIDAGAYELLLSDLPNRVNLSVSQTSASEASATTVTVTVTADFQVSGDQTLSLNVTGTADAADHSALPSTISILDGQTTGTATFTLIDDPDDEPSETVILTLSNPSAGITLGSTIVQTVTILDDDVITPSVPDLLGSSDTGVSDSDDVTSDATPTFTGTAKPLDTVTLFADGTPVGTATADGAGNWTITTSPLPAGATSITAHASDGAGNQSSLSAGLTITVDNAAPAAPSVTGITSDTGTSGDGITADNTLTYNGTAQANTSVALFMDGTPLGTVQANGSGHWSFSAPSTLTDGTYTITAQATDLAGNTSAISTGFPLTVDTAAPAAPIITGVTQDTGTPGDGITSDFTPTLSGTAEPNTQLELYRDGVSVGTIPVNGAGTWNFASTTLANGTYVFTARVTDLAGNTSPASAPLSVTVDAAAPAAPIIIGISDDTGTAGDGTTSDDTPTLSGTAEADTSIELFRDGVSLGTVKADGSGMWSFASATLADGDYSFTARATDAAGNASALSTAVSVTIDTGAPPAPTISAIAGDTGTPGDGITSDATPTLSGTAEPHASLEVFIDGVSAGIVQADAAGAWSFAATNLPDGNYSFTAQATDLAGNVSAVSSVFPVVINTSAPAAPVISGISADTGTPGDGITSDNSPTLSGTGEPNATVEVFRDGVSIGTQTVNSSGSWSMVVTTLTDGTYDFSAQLTDAAGNTSARSSDFAVTVDTSIALLGAPDLLAASDSGASDSDDITRETTPTFTGTGAEAGATIYLLSDQDGSIGTTTADGSGAWQITASILSNGAHAISAVQSDLAGNSSLPGATLAIIVDTSTPAAPVIAGFSDDTGTPGDGITIDSTPTLSGTADANTTVELLRDGVLVDTTQADASGTWSITSPALPGGVYAFTARAVTAAGNASAPSGATQITISTSGPPSVLSIAQNSPAQSTTNADTLIFRVTFSEDVQGVNAGDFAVTGGTTATVSQITPVSGAVYDVQISGGDLQGFNGTVGLSLTDDDSI
ncbi:MAG: Ig-like domain-containing protein, partial [Pelagimonas sp.]|nr:Ig-like domain-containing protein [Pelagimonas sp.]